MDDAAVQSLPDDPRLLKALLIEHDQQLAQRENRIAQLEQQNRQIELENQRIELENRRIESRQEELERKQAELELEKLRLEQQLMQALRRLYGPRGDRLTSEGDARIASRTPGTPTSNWRTSRSSRSKKGWPVRASSPMSPPLSSPTTVCKEKLCSR